MSETELLSYCRRYREILCYGAGRYGRIIRIFLLEHGIDIAAFLVSKTKEKQNAVLEKKVCQISDFLYDRAEQGILLCANEAIRSDMELTLQQQGITEYFIVDELLVKELDAKTQYNTIFRMKGVNTLLYHRVANLESDIWKLAVTPENFEFQIKYLKENYNIIRFEEDWPEEAENTVAITFDDGYLDNYRCALPILEKYEVPATIFVCTGNMGTDKEFWWDELENIFICGENKPISDIAIFGKRVNLKDLGDRVKLCYRVREEILKMPPDEREKFFADLKQQVQYIDRPRDGYRTIREEELRELDRSPWITIGGHTVTHSRLTSETEEQQMWEIKESKKIIEDIVGHSITVFSYPFGSKDDYDIRTIGAALKAGYKKVAAVALRYEDSKLYETNIPRICIQQTIDEKGVRGLQKQICLSSN